MFPAPIHTKGPWAVVSYRVAVIISLILWLIPLLAIALTSVRSLEDISKGNLWGWPSKFLLIENYSAVFTTTPMATFLLNSVLITVPTVIGSIALAAMAGFALAKYKFRGNIILFAMFIAGNFIPFQILMIPVRDLMIGLGMYDSIGGLVAFHIAFQSGFCTLFMRNFIKALPDALIEAARMEGVSEVNIFFRIILPLVRPALAALAVLIFTFVWNDYFWALVLAQTDAVRPVTAGLQSLKGMWVSSWQLISAGSIIAALLPVSIFFMMQRHFIAGLTLGATKE
ncbi:carbohydrate ABC transporter permease [Elstera sp.]|jgi:multiple sugar transport system permease protein|uniref:carbohydrate ABC transporter permease n=1 Tax=Elstera sp. TaxID=1916664 RepID=UPI0037BF2A7B